MEVYCIDALRDDLDLYEDGNIPEHVKGVLDKWWISENDREKDLSELGILIWPVLTLIKNNEEEWEIYLAGTLIGGRRAWKENGFNEAGENLSKYIRHESEDFIFHLPVIWNINQNGRLCGFKAYGESAEYLMKEWGI